MTKSSLPGPRQPPLLYQRVRTHQPFSIRSERLESCHAPHHPVPHSPHPSLLEDQTLTQRNNWAPATYENSTSAWEVRAGVCRTVSRSCLQPDRAFEPPGAVTTTEAGSLHDYRDDSIGLAQGLGTGTLKAVPSSPHAHRGWACRLRKGHLEKMVRRGPKSQGHCQARAQRREAAAHQSRREGWSELPGEADGGGADPWVLGGEEAESLWTTRQSEASDTTNGSQELNQVHIVPPSLASHWVRLRKVDSGFHVCVSVLRPPPHRSAVRDEARHV